MRYTSSVLLLAGLSNALPFVPRADYAPADGSTGSGSGYSGGSGEGSGEGSGQGSGAGQGSGSGLLSGLPSIPGLSGGSGGAGQGSGSGLLSGLPSLPSGLPSLPIPGLGGSGEGSGAGSGLLSGLPSLPTDLPSLPIPGLGGSGEGSGAGSGLGSGSGLLSGLPSLPLPSLGSGSGALPTLPIPGLGGSGEGSGSGLLPGLPSLGSGLGGIVPGLGGGSESSAVPSVPTPTGSAAPAYGSNGSGSGDVAGTTSKAVTQPTQTEASGEGSVDSDCTPQKSSGGATENGVANKNCCTDVTVIFARGTGEPGNMGIISGPPMVKALRQKLGADKVTVQGVDYPADAAGNANLGASGGPTMASLVKASKSQCPSSKIILSGYSQGAMVVHNALRQGVSGADVAGAVLFGDPLKTQALGEVKTKEFCASQDSICGTGNDLQGSHISYGSVGGEAADWIAGVVGGA